MTDPVRLAPDGVWLAAASPRRWWALTPPFHPYRRRLRRDICRRWRSPFCATFRRLSPPGISPASCPSVSGLSSRRAVRQRRTPARGHPACREIVAAELAGGSLDGGYRGRSERGAALRASDLAAGQMEQ